MEAALSRSSWKGTPLRKVLESTINTVVGQELDINKEDFSMDELMIACKSLKSGKASGLDEIPGEVWKIRSFSKNLLYSCNSVFHGNKIDRWLQGCILPFPKKGDLSIPKNYRGITLTFNSLPNSSQKPKWILRKQVHYKSNINIKTNYRGSAGKKITSSNSYC